MIRLVLVGIGTGNPEHLTLQAIRAIEGADLILLPRKGADKADLAELRREICSRIVSNPGTVVAEFDLPLRDAANPAYRDGVHVWHAEIAATWAREIRRHLGVSGTVALLIWGDPSLYDSSLRIAARMDLQNEVRVIPGVTSLQVLCAGHAIPLNEIGAPFLVTTGRRLREDGWPAGVDTLAVMLDGGCAFQTLDPAGISIWWGAYLGMGQEILRAGRLVDIGPEIVALRAEARASHGWIMDIYILRRSGDTD